VILQKDVIVKIYINCHKTNISIELQTERIKNPLIMSHYAEVNTQQQSQE
jgi:hypothetical protein